MKSVAAAFRRHPVLFPVFVLALVAVVFFGMRTVHDAVRWGDRFGQEPVVAGWMTPRYIVRTWNIPPRLIADVLELKPGEAPRMTISELALERGMTPPELADALEQAIRDWQEAQK